MRSVTSTSVRGVHRTNSAQRYSCARRWFHRSCSVLRCSCASRGVHCHCARSVPAPVVEFLPHAPVVYAAPAHVTPAHVDEVTAPGLQCTLWYLWLRVTRSSLSKTHGVWSQVPVRTTCGCSSRCNRLSGSCGRRISTAMMIWSCST